MLILASKTKTDPDRFLSASQKQYRDRLKQICPIEYFSVCFEPMHDGADEDSEANPGEFFNRSLTDDVRQIITDRHVLLGAVFHDDSGDVPDPMEEGTCNGRVVHHSRTGGDKEEDALYRDVRGIDGQGERDFHARPVLNYWWAWCLQQLHTGSFADVVQWYRHQLGNPYEEELLYQIRKRLEQAMQTSESEAVDRKLVPLGSWGRLSSLIGEAALAEAFANAAEIHPPGDELALLLDCYEHGAVRYSLSGCGFQCEWDTSPSAAVWIPCADARENIFNSVLSKWKVGSVMSEAGAGTTRRWRYKILPDDDWSRPFRSAFEAATAAIEVASVSLCYAHLVAELRQTASAYFKPVLEEYNNARNGWVYGYQIICLDRETGLEIELDDDTAWGFLGDDYVQSELDEALVLALSWLNRPTTPAAQAAVRLAA